MQSVGVIAIGRNEGQRLLACLQSVVGDGRPVVYVDSGSTDGSVEMARSMGVTVVDLDLTIPFTAARARNAGLERLLQVAPTTEFVQFIDGDCQVVPGWLDFAYQTLIENPEVVVVCGRRREQFPDRSIYNRLCDIEWDTPVGEAKACGGDAMMRVAAIQAVGGYNPTLIAGEEPELCVRLRQRGGRIWRLDAEMTLHDAQMTRFEQWWKRTLRAGHAFAEGAFLHGKPPERHWVKESRSITIWGLGLPLLAIGLAYPTRGLSLALLLALYGVQVFRVMRSMQRRGLKPNDAFWYGMSCIFGKIPQAQGQLRFWMSRLLNRRSTLVEYKTRQS